MTAPGISAEVVGQGFVAVCSNKPRPSVQRGAKGSQWWRRDPYHVRHPLDAELTLCGRDCSDWLVVGPMETLTDDCCTLCRKRANPS